MADLQQLHFLLDSNGALIVFQETGASWASVLAFSSGQRAREFVESSNLEVEEIAAVDPSDRDAIAALIRSVKRRTVRNLLLDLDYASGACTAIEFEGDALGVSHQYQMSPNAHARKP